ncbi:MAG: asparagine synthase (glutamine-hydrolyzing) [Bacteroidales bacterium]|nr:asparagine synthase (glutamine-hydrolyzing) [Bacteroidales bacterium]
MCGISGFFDLSMRILGGNYKNTLNAMMKSIVHRGPDDHGTWFNVEDGIGLGFRRLSIIDLTHTGHQPMHSSDGHYTIIFNGEIYNFKEIRNDLKRIGSRFSGNSDTEVILEAVCQMGIEKAIKLLNGMFAIAIWDKKEKTLSLIRDRMGIKPLYYYWDGELLIFSSEIKAILASGQSKKFLDERSLWDYLTFRFVPQPETIWKNVFKLLPGHFLKISLDTQKPEITSYWSVDYSEQDNISQSEAIASFENLFLDAVEKRLVADVPVGVLLSGGLDSSAVVAALTELDVKLDSFSVGFDCESVVSELPYARLVSQYLRTNHHEIIIGKKEILSFLPQFVKYTDEPLADLASIPLYFVSSLARKNVTAVLSGEGSDEVLAGYDFERWVQIFEKRAKTPNYYRVLNQYPSFARRLIMCFPDLEDKLQTAAEPQDLRGYARIPYMTDLFSSVEKEALSYPGWQNKFPDSQVWLQNDLDKTKARHPLHQFLYLYCKQWLVEDLLMKADKMTMANSLELRVPFLDHRLVEWAAKMPAWVKVSHERDNKYINKWVLRRFSENRLPAEIINRKKMGFPVPMYGWLSNELKPFAHSLLSGNNTKLLRWFDRDAIQVLLKNGTHHDASNIERHRLWSLLIFELWCNEWQPE